MKRYHLHLISFLVGLSLISCQESDPETSTPKSEIESLESRPFNMGFTSWTYGPEAADVEDTYQFILKNGDIYSEQFDHRIPWSSWINNSPLPQQFVDNLNYRLSKRPAGKKMLLSVSLLNIGRTDLLEDYDGKTPMYDSINEPKIENSYIKHLAFLIEKFNPTYLVFAMEVNELRVKDATKWNNYKKLAAQIQSRIKNSYPQLLVSESVTLHNWYNPYQTHTTEYMEEIRQYVNQKDFVAISFYPFLMALHTKSEIQGAFDFLHQQTTKPIAFSETAHNATPIDIPAFNFYSNSTEAEQNGYLETVLLNGTKHNYEFIIWWCHRDYDKLFEIFPDESKDLGLLWRDTGLLDENGTQRDGFNTWKIVFEKPNR